MLPRPCERFGRVEKHSHGRGSTLGDWKNASDAVGTTFRLSKNASDVIGSTFRESKSANDVVGAVLGEIESRSTLQNSLFCGFAGHNPPVFVNYQARKGVLGVRPMRFRLSHTRCVRCQSYRVIEGSLTTLNGSVVFFQPFHLKWWRQTLFFKFSSSMAIESLDMTYICLKCGLLWKEQNAENLQQICEKWGDETLQELLKENQRLDEESEITS